MPEKKLSTAEILAAARAEAARKAGKTPPTSEETEEKPEEAAPASESASQPEGSAPEAASQPPAEPPQAEAEQSEAPKPKPSATPRSTKDILAAARAQARAKGKAPAAPSKPAAAAEPKAKPKPAAAPSKPSPARTGEHPSVQEMVRAVREGKPPKPPEPPKPRKPHPVRKPPEKRAKTRRSFLVAMVATPFALAWTSLTVALGVGTLALLRFMFPNVLVEPPTRFKVGPPDDYPAESVSTKWKSSRGIWIVHTSQYDGRNLIYALRSVCTHLGCTPNWLEAEQKFKCPCHGSGFYITGINFEGPAPRPLERVGIRLAEDGMLEVDKSRKFQEELGQWQDPASYVELA